MGMGVQLDEACPGSFFPPVNGRCSKCGHIVRVLGNGEGAKVARHRKPPWMSNVDKEVAR